MHQLSVSFPRNRLIIYYNKKTSKSGRLLLGGMFFKTIYLPPSEANGGYSRVSVGLKGEH